MRNLTLLAALLAASFASLFLLLEPVASKNVVNGAKAPAASKAVSSEEMPNPKTIAIGGVKKGLPKAPIEFRPENPPVFRSLITAEGKVIQERKIWIRRSDGKVEEKFVRIIATPMARPVKVVSRADSRNEK